jgi:hypothetical protein
VGELWSGVIACALVVGLGCSPAAHDRGGSAPTNERAEGRAPWPPVELDRDTASVLAQRTMYRIEPSFALEPTSRADHCTLSGSVEAVRLPLYSSASDDQPFAILERGTFKAVTLPASLHDPVSAQLSWPLSSTVVLHQESLPFSIGKSKPLAIPVAWLGSGARVAAARTDQAGAVVVARHWVNSPAATFEPSNFQSVIACDELELPRLDVLFRADRHDPFQQRQGENAELIGIVGISEHPESRPLARIGGDAWPVSLHRVSGGSALVSDRSAGSWGRVGFDFAGWVPASNVRRGGLPVAVDFGRVPLRTQHRSCPGARLLLSPDPHARSVATLADGVPLLVIGHERDFANVLVPEITASSGATFWLHRSGVCTVPEPP